MLALLLACEPALDSGGEAEAVELVPAANWSLSGELILPVLEVHPDVNLRPAPVKDLLGEDSPPLAGVELFWLAELSLDELQTRLLRGTLTQSDVSAFAFGDIGPGGLLLDDLVTNGLPPPVSGWLEDGSGTFVLTASGSNWALVLEPSTSGPTSAEVIGGGILSATGTVGETFTLPAGTDRVSWAGLTTNAWGDPWDSQPVDRAVLYAFESEADAEAAAASPLTAKPSATYEASVLGSRVRFDDLESEEEGTFTEFDDRVWVLTLHCEACAVHFPVYATRVVPE